MASSLAGTVNHSKIERWLVGQIADSTSEQFINVTDASLRNVHYNLFMTEVKWNVNKHIACCAYAPFFNELYMRFLVSQTGYIVIVQLYGWCYIHIIGQLFTILFRYNMISLHVSTQM